MDRKEQRKVLKAFLELANDAEIKMIGKAMFNMMAAFAIQTEIISAAEYLDLDYKQPVALKEE